MEDGNGLLPHGGICASVLSPQSGRDSQAVEIRVLHGLSGAAGQPGTLAQAQRRLGCRAESVCLGESKYGYDADHFLPRETANPGALHRFLIDASNRFNVFHFYFRPFFYPNSKSLAFPTGLDLLMLRAAGKVVVFHYRGSEVRTAERFRELSPFHYVDENPANIFGNFPTPTVTAFREYVQGVANLVLVPDPELQSYVPGATIVPRAIDLTKWEFVGVPDQKEPLVVHAPSRRVVKGSDAVLRAVSDLRAEGLEFEFALIENLSNEAAREIYRRASIVVDQLRIGWYGVLSVEAMALGKAVIAYVRDDLVEHLGAPVPLQNANPNTVKDALRELIQRPDRRKELGLRGRRYCEEVHDADLVARNLIDLYARELADPTPVRVEACLRYFHVQKKHTTFQHTRLLGLRPSQNWASKYWGCVKERGIIGGTGKALHRLWTGIRRRQS